MSTKQKLILFDSCAFIHYFRGRQEANIWIKKVVSKSIIGGISPFTDFELWLGNPKPNEEKAYRILIAQFKRLNFHATIARKAAELFIPYMRNSQNSRMLPDCFLASTALYYNADILTNNIAHFESFGLPNVELIDYMKVND